MDECMCFKRSCSLLSVCKRHQAYLLVRLINFNNRPFLFCCYYYSTPHRLTKREGEQGANRTAERAGGRSIGGVAGVVIFLRFYHKIRV